MNKCRYNRTNLPEEASNEHRQVILNAIITRQIIVSGKAERMVRYSWEMSIAAFIAAVQAHVNDGHRVFYKSVSDAPPGFIFLQANVRLDPESSSEEDDVYVEIRVSGRVVAVICNAHDHWTHEARLPK